MITDAQNHPAINRLMSDRLSDMMYMIAVRYYTRIVHS